MTRASPFVAAMLATLGLAGCDQPAPGYRPAAPVVARHLSERSGPVSWNTEADRFSSAGRPLRHARLWTFEGSTDGFTTAKSQLALADDKGLRLKVVDPSLRSPRGLGIEGWTYSLVLVRLTRLRSGNAWDGALYYTTAAHPESAQFLAKPISGGDPAVNETTILVYDMNRLAAGGDDWANSVIDQIRLDIEGAPGGEFLIHQVAVAANPGPVVAPILR